MCVCVMAFACPALLSADRVLRSTECSAGPYVTYFYAEPGVCTPYVCPATVPLIEIAPVAPPARFSCILIPKARDLCSVRILVRLESGS